MSPFISRLLGWNTKRDFKVFMPSWWSLPTLLDAFGILLRSENGAWKGEGNQKEWTDRDERKKRKVGVFCDAIYQPIGSATALVPLVPVLVDFGASTMHCCLSMFRDITEWISNYVKSVKLSVILRNHWCIPIHNRYVVGRRKLTPVAAVLLHNVVDTTVCDWYSLLSAVRLQFPSTFP